MALPSYVEAALRKSTARADAAPSYPHLASDRDVAVARAYRQQVDREIATINRGLPDEAASRVQPRPRVTQEQAVNVLYPHLTAQANRERERYERWEDMMRPWGFKRAPQGQSDWWSRKGK